MNHKAPHHTKSPRIQLDSGIFLRKISICFSASKRALRNRQKSEASALYQYRF